jgi:predicted nucleotidyltransferase
MIKKQYKQYLKKYAEILTKEGIKVEALYLFGSRAKGTNHQYSDLDTCIVSPNFGKDYCEETINLMKLTRKASWLIEPHPFSLTDFNDKSNDFAREIQKTGIQII